MVIILRFSLFLLLGLSLPALADPLPLPLETMPGKSFADVQAQAKTESGTGPVWGNAPDPATLPFHATLSGSVTADATMTKLAIFSDDGCDVTVDGVKVWSARDKPQALPDLPNSLHELPVTLTPGTHTVQIDYSNVIYTVADAANGIPPDIDGCTLFQYGPKTVVNVHTNSWQPNPAGVQQPINSTVTTTVDNPYQSSNGDSISEHWAWDTTGVYQSKDGTSGSFTTYGSGYSISWAEGDSSTIFTGSFDDVGYYIIKVTATLTYHDDTTNADVGTYTGDGYIGGSAGDLAPPTATPSAASPRVAMSPSAAGAPATTFKGVPVAAGTTVVFKEAAPASGLDVTLPNSTDMPTVKHDLIIPVPGLIVPFDPNPNPYHGNLTSIFAEINPKPSPNQIHFQPSSSGAGLYTVSPTTASYAEEGLLFTGVKVGETGLDVVGAAGSPALAHLKVAVLGREDVTIDFHFMSDTADATHPAHSTSRTAADVDAMVATANSIWNKQANVFFEKGTVDSVKYSTNLGDSVDTSTVDSWDGNKTVAKEINVYFVWGITGGNPGLTAHHDEDRVLQLTLISDSFMQGDSKARLTPSAEGKILAHELGHDLQIVGDYPDRDPDYLMTHDVSGMKPFQYTDNSWGLTWTPRIHYDEAKTANPFPPAQ